MKIDYELVEEIGATHYNTSNSSLYKVDKAHLLVYSTGDWERSGLTKADIVTLLKPIPPKPQVRVEYEKVEYKHIWEVMKMQSEGIDLYVKTDTTESGYGLIQNNPTSLLVASTSDLYHRVEKSIDWKDELKALGYFVEYEIADGSGEFRIDEDDFLYTARLALKANGEL